MPGFSNWKNLLVSTLSLLIVSGLLNLVSWLTMVFGAYMSDFDGEIIWNISHITASSVHWSWNQVMWIYLAPYIALLFLFAIIKWKRKYPTSIHIFLQSFQSWAFLLLISYLFFMPMVDIVTKQGIYHVLNWLGIASYLQIIIGILLLMYFIVSSFNVSTLFSTQLEVPMDKLITTKQVMVQLPLIWYIPIALLTAVVYLLSSYSFPPSFIYFLSGTTFIILVNTWLISRYNVIVK